MFTKIKGITEKIYNTLISFKYIIPLEISKFPTF